jgi:hypothetical protein
MIKRWIAAPQHEVVSLAKKNPQRRASGDGGLSAGALLCRGLFASTAERLKALDGATLVCGLERGGLLTQPAETN